jgi:multicomponent Na+:H+ antiporter subunit G
MAAVGTVLTLLAWFFLVGGTWRGLARKEPLARLHYLGIADTLGGLLLLAGLAFRHPERWLQLLLGALALLAWGPLTTYLIGWGATGGEAER